MNHTENQKQEVPIRVATPHRTEIRKRKLLLKQILIFSSLFLLVAQGFSQPLSAPNNSICNLGRTGVSINSTTGAMTSINSGSDPRWQVSTTNWATTNTSGWGSVPNATIFTPPSTPTVCQALDANGTNTGDPRWITLPAMSCTSSPACYTCVTPAVTDLYYRLTFSLQPCSILAIDWVIFASDYVADISVNGVPAYTTNYTSSYPTQRGPSPTTFKWCTNWKYGSTAAQLNDIRVHIKVDASLLPSCKFVGMKIFTWGTNPARYTSLTAGPSTLCTGQSASYSGATMSGATYSWTGIPGWAGTLPNSNTYSTISGTNSGVVSLAYLTPVSTGYACNSVAGICVNVPPPLTVTATSPTLCTGKCATLTALGANSYTWSGPGVTTPNANPITVCPPLGTSIYTVKGSGVVGSCVVTKTIALQTYQTPTVGVVASPTSICAGNCTSITISGNAWHYSLSPCGASVSCQIFTWSPIALCPSVTTNYSITGMSIQGCTNIASANVVVNPNPTVTAVANPSVVCVGGGPGCVLTASGANSYIWSTNAGTPLAQNPKTVFPPGNTTYTVTGSIGTCTASKTVSVATIAAPQITVTPPNICPGISNTLTAMGGNSYNWTLGIAPSATIVNNTPTVIITATAAVPYTVCGTGVNSCTACYFGTITPGSPIPITAPNVTLCSNSSGCTTITVSSTLSPVTYTWVSGTTPTTGSAVTICATTPTSYVVNASSTLSGCPSSATLAVAIASNCCPQPTAGLTQLGSALSGSYTNTSYLLNVSTTLTNSAFFKNSEVWITENVTITVPSGQQLQLDKTHLFACGAKMWQGIVVQDGGRINTVNTQTAQSMIEDAIVAVELNSISATNAAPNLPINISRIIFNRNYIGIKISNSVPTLTFLPLGITGCVFSSRSMTYASYPATLSWPNNDNTTTFPNALRWPTTVTTGIAPPYGYLASTFAQANLKIPYTNQPGQIGIKIENIGDPNATGFPTFTNVGVDIGVTATTSISNDINLFEGIGNGIDITDASLVTTNNTFQNLQYYSTPSGMFGGNGINHVITPASQRFTRLDLRNGNNNFWDCNVGVNASNIYECWITNSVFRSTHMVWSAYSPLQTIQGDVGVNYDSEQFNFSVETSQFNNLRKGIIFRSSNGPIGYGSLLIFQNYFGPEVTSNTNYSSSSANTSEYMDAAIDVVAPNGTWGAGAGTWLIESNKIHRAFRGISFDGFADPPVNILGNYIVLEDDQTYPLVGQYGISVQNNLGNMAITSNTVDATNNWNFLSQTTSAVYCTNNYHDIGTGSPFVSCNSVANTHFGFQFDGSNDSTVWQGNTMCNNKYGLGLTTNGIIGQQGTGSIGNNNNWLDPPYSNGVCSSWNSFLAYQQTYCENSLSTLSPLYVHNAVNSVPNWNMSVPAGNAYSFTGPPSLFYATSRINDCANLPAGLNPPSWRLANSSVPNKAADTFDEKLISIYPNPTNRQMMIAGYDQEVTVTIMDVSGKVVLAQTYLASNRSVDLSNLPASVYIVQIKNSEGKTIHKKLVKTE